MKTFLPPHLPQQSADSPNRGAIRATYLQKLRHWSLNLLLLLPAEAAAQRPFSLTVAARAQVSQARFSDDALVSARVGLAPSLYSGWLLRRGPGLVAAYGGSGGGGLHLLRPSR